MWDSKRHRCTEQSFGLCGRVRGRDDLGEGIEMCKLSYMKWITSPGLMHDTGCLGLVHWDDPEGWYREGGKEERRELLTVGRYVHPGEIASLDHFQQRAKCCQARMARFKKNMTVLKGHYVAFCMMRWVNVFKSILCTFPPWVSPHPCAPVALISLPQLLALQQLPFKFFKCLYIFNINLFILIGG